MYNNYICYIHILLVKRGFYVKTKQWSKLAGVLFTTGTIGLTVSPVYAADITGNNGLVEITDGQSYSEDNIYGWYKTDATNVTKGKVNISGGTIDCSSIYGGYSKNGISTNIQPI